MQRLDRTRVGTATGLSAVAALVLTTLGPLADASAVPPASPTGLSVQQPNDATAVLSWDHVAGATRYELQVDDDPNFGSPASIPAPTVSTVNNTYVPTANLPAGDKYWRVRARNAANEDSPWAISQFGTPAVAVPQPASPADNTTLSQPSQPPLLTWSTSPGATSYIVEVDGDADFVGATPYTTSSTSLVVPDALPAGTTANPADYYWRVTASKGSGLNSFPSPASRFIVGPLPAPVITAPPSSPNFELQDVVLDWEPVPGAKSYDVEVALNQDFTNILKSETGIQGTRYSPPVSYDNDQYYWRVRARDLDNQPTPWTASLYDFNRTWPDKPQAVFPAEPGAETVENPVYFEWTSVRHASEYELQVSTTPGFSEGSTRSCRTAGTTYTPGMFAINTTGIPSAFRENEDCEPTPGTINYWHVRPLDRPFTKPGGGDIPGIQGIYSDTEAFLYNPAQITGMEPANGATVTVPTFTWDSAPGAESYSITVYNNQGNQVDTVKTYATSYTVDGTTPLPASGNPYTWALNATTADGISSVRHTRSFSVTGTPPAPPASSGDYLRPVTGNGPFQTAPSLTWQPHPDAVRYKVNIGYAMDSNQIWFGHAAGQDLFNQPMPYNAMTDIGDRLLLPGTYDWQVTAVNSSGGEFASGPEGRFTVSEVDVTSEHALAIGGRELDPNNPATKTPCNPLSGPCVVPTTPVLKWKAQPYTSYYMVYVSRDSNFTNLLEPSNAIPATTNTRYAPALDNRWWTYPDTEAGEALYWHIRPCRKVNNCAPSPISAIGRAQHAFTKTSPKVEGLTSTDPTRTEITFSWNDYFDTNRSTQWAQTGEDRPQSAMLYRIQVDDVESFGTGSALVDERIVDQATYTAFDRLYPEGTLYWRVQAIDSKGSPQDLTNNDGRLSWSETKTFTKRSPRVELTAPVDGASVPGTVALRWQAQPFAAEYKVEVYKNNDTTFSTANRVFTKNVRTTAYAHNVPLPVSPTPYVWRVQRIDTDGNPGPWSWGGNVDPDGNPVGRFTVGSGILEITSPAPGGAQPPNGPVLTWRDFPGAVKYNVEVSSPAGGFAATGQTVATAYALTNNVSTGTYPFKVTALDANNTVLGSAQSSFVVDARLVATAPPEVQAPTGTGVGATLTSTPPSWNQADVSTTYQWLRDGQPIAGATGTTYVLTVSDFNRIVSLRVTGKKSGFTDGVTVSNAVGATAGGALQATAQPTITGIPQVGNTLTGVPGTWSQPSPTFKYQWLRTGAPIPNANSASYRLTPEDAGKDIAVTVLASKSGFTDGSAAAAAVTVPKMTSTTTATLSATRVKPGKRVKVGITVMVPGVTGPVGQIKVMDRTKVLKKLTLVTAKNGKVTVRLPKLKRGKHRIRVKYLGDATTQGSRSKAMRLSVQP
ncbi:Ig-like domain repeat protein [Nocardioides furvisabuli]|nr:Ig-like domain repeat protein [Nocardioides furvisabuli]